MSTATSYAQQKQNQTRHTHSAPDRRGPKRRSGSWPRPRNLLLEQLEDRRVLSGVGLVSMAHPDLLHEAANGPTSPIQGADAVSADGRYVVFLSKAENLVSDLEIVPVDNVYRFDRLTNEVELVSVNVDGTGSANRNCFSPVISSDGSVVAFSSGATNLHPLDTDPGFDAYARDLRTETTHLVSVNSTGTAGGNGGSGAPVISADGSVVAFSSDASNLHPLDTDTMRDVFTRDLTTQTTQLVSVNMMGTGSGDGHSDYPTISADRSVVAFVSDASNLHPLDTDTITDVFARDLRTEITHLMSVNVNGSGSGNGSSFNPVISGDGSVVAFTSSATDLNSLDTDTLLDVFARDLRTETTHLVSVNTTGNGSGNSHSDRPVISADGSVVAFRSSARNLQPLDTDAMRDIFTRDLSTQTTHLVSVNTMGTGSGNGHSDNPVISADGSVVAFGSEASNLVRGDSNRHRDVFVFTETTTVIASRGAVSSTASDASRLESRDWMPPGGVSANGRYVVFLSSAENLVADLEIVPGVQNVYRFDRLTKQVQLVSVNVDGIGSGNGHSSNAVISADGSVVAFRSEASNLHPLDTDTSWDVFARDFRTGTTHLVSVNMTGSGSGNGHSNVPELSADGSVVAFQSSASNLHPLDTDTITDVFVRDLHTETIHLVSVNVDGTGSGNANSYSPKMSADGSVVVFNSSASNLHPLDTDTMGDVFLRDLHTETTHLVSVNTTGTGSGNASSSSFAISADGSVVAFLSYASDLHPLDTDTTEGTLAADIFARDLRTETTHLVSVNADGNGSGNGWSSFAVISADGSVVAFHSDASNLHPLDTDTNKDVFARDLRTETTHLVSVNADGNGNARGSYPVISADGSVVAFVSQGNVFSRDLRLETTYLVSVNTTATGGGNGISEHPMISADGTVVAFDSLASNLVEADWNGTRDVFYFSVQANYGLQANLTIAQIEVPASISAAQSFNLDYAVTNLGPDAISGRRVDTILLSTDHQLDSADRVLARFVRDDELARGEEVTYTSMISGLSFADFPPGEYWIFVRINAGKWIAETDYTDNVSGVEMRIERDVRTLVLDQPTTGNITEGETIIYELTATVDEPLSIALDGLAAGSTAELYLRHGDVPTARSHLLAARRPFSSSQNLFLPSVQPGSYYIVVHGLAIADGVTPYTLTAHVPQFEVTTSYFGTGGTAGDYTIAVRGASFDRTVSAELLGPEDFDLQAKTHWYESGQTIHATFDLRNVPPGTYDVRFVNGQGSSVIVPSSFTVVSVSDTAEVIPRVHVPAEVGQNREYRFTISWTNQSLNDAPAPLLMVGNTVPFGLARGDYSLGTQYTFLGTNTQGGPPGILRPGQRESIAFWAFSGLEDGEHTVFVDRHVKDLSETFDWNALRPRLIPPDMSDEDFEPIFQQLVSQVGSTAGDYLWMLSRNASILPVSPAEMRDPASLLAIEFERAWAAVSLSISGALFGDVSDDMIGLQIVAENVSDGQSYAASILGDTSFAFPGLSPGQYRLIMPGYRVSTGLDDLLILTTSDSVSALSVTIEKAGLITLTLEAAGDSTPILDGSVLVFRDDQAVGSGEIRDGFAVIPGLEDGDYVLSIDAPGYARTWSDVTISGDVADINLSLADHSLLRGSLSPAGDDPVLFAVALLTDDQPDCTFFAVSSGHSFEFTGLPAGTYDVYVSNGTATASITGVVLTAGTTLDLGEMDTPGSEGFSAASTLLMSSSTGEIDPVTQVQLLATKGFLQTVFIPLITARLGLSVGRLWNKFINTSPSNPSGVQQFGDGSSIVEGTMGIWLEAFPLITPGLILVPVLGYRNYPEVKAAISRALNAAADYLKSNLSESDREILSSGITFEYPVQALLGNNHPDLTPDINFGRIFTIPGNIAGGVGWWDSAQGRVYDSRRIGGNVVARLEGCNTLIIESRLTFQVVDTITFNPGDPGRLIEQVFTQPLGFLERHNWAYGVPHHTEFTDRPGNSVSRTLEPTDECTPEDPDDEEEVERPTSWDPNDILGPKGVGEQHWIDVREPLGYMIRFENDAELASAPAQMVRVVQTLDSDLDWTSFRLGFFGFGTVYVEVPDDTAFYETRLDVTDSLGVYVDVRAGIDIHTGVVFWEFTSIDPATGDLPESPLVGFLPPNVEPPEGDGFVTYSIRPKSDSATGTVIDAEARIFFDFNDPIDTPPIFNTIDAGPPTSWIEPLPAVVNSLDFPVTWDGVDDAGGSGIGRYDIYVSIDDAPFTRWLAGATEHSAVFTGEFGRRYAFYSVATDRVRHREAVPSSGEAATYVNIPPVIGTLSVSPDAVERGSNLTLTAHAVSDPDGWVVLVEFYHEDELLGQADGSDGWSWTGSTTGWDLGEHTLRALALDNDGGWSQAVDVTVTVQKGSPVADAGGPYVGFEGAELVLDASASYDPDGDALLYRWDFDDDGQWDTDWLTEPVVRRTWDDDWAGIIRLEVSNGPLAAVATAPVTIQNVPPIATFQNDGPVSYGQAVVVAFSHAFDPSVADTNAGFRYAFARDAAELDSVTYEDGSSEALSWTVTGLAAGEHTIYGRILDKDDGFTQYATTVIVNKALLTVTADEQVKIYGEDDPLLTYQATGFQFDETAATVLTGALARQPGEDVGDYQILQGTLVAVTGNYTIAFNGAVFRILADAAPVARDDYHEMDEDTVLVAPLPGVLANDSSSGGGFLTAALCNPPEHGYLAFNLATGAFSYRPFENFHGQDTFTYFAVSGSLKSEPATVTITVRPVNDPPVAGDDMYTVVQGDALNISAEAGLLANDTDVDGDVLTVRNVSAVNGGGGLTVNQDGSFTYTPAAGFTGTASFTYEAWDGWATSTATVRIEVTASQATPEVESVVINDGSAQRSMVQSLNVTFASVVDLQAEHFRLVNRNSGTEVGLALAKSDAGGKSVVTLTFTGAGIVGGSLADGNYLLTIDLEKDGLGTGNDHQFGAAQADNFFRLFGDSDGDRDVDNLDYFRFRGASGQTSDSPKYLGYFDYDQDDDVDADDLAEFLARYRTALAWL